MTTNQTATAKQIAAATEDAYSCSRYTPAAWIGIARALLEAGADADEAHWVLMSKHTRWAADGASRNHGTTLADFLNYVKSGHVGSLEKLIAAARRELKPAAAPASLDGAYLAGACEGEDIADLIDLARALRADGITNYGPRAARILETIERRAADRR